MDKDPWCCASDKLEDKPTIVGYGVFDRVPNLDFQEHWEYVQVGLIFESAAQAHNVREYAKKKRKGGDYVICQLQEKP